MLKGGEMIWRGPLVTDGIGEEEARLRSWKRSGSEWSLPLVADRRFQPTGAGGRHALWSSWKLKSKTDSHAVLTDFLNAIVGSALC